MSRKRRLVIDLSGREQEITDLTGYLSFAKWSQNHGKDNKAIAVISGSL